MISNKKLLKISKSKILSDIFFDIIFICYHRGVKDEHPPLNSLFYGEGGSVQFRELFKLRKKYKKSKGITNSSIKSSLSKNISKLVSAGLLFKEKDIYPKTNKIFQINYTGINKVIELICEDFSLPKIKKPFQIKTKSDYFFFLGFSNYFIRNGYKKDLYHLLLSLIMVELSYNIDKAVLLKDFDFVEPSKPYKVKKLVEIVKHDKQKEEKRDKIWNTLKILAYIMIETKKGHRLKQIDIVKDLRAEEPWWSSSYVRPMINKLISKPILKKTSKGYLKLDI